jgi:hypothetical protein
VAALAVAPVSSALASSASIHTSRSCYQVGQTVDLSGQGFLASSEFDLSIDGIDFGQSTTSSRGAFHVSFGPGGLAAGQPQIVDQAIASDGQSSAHTTFTVTRSTNALVGTGSGSSLQRRVSFEAWDFGGGQKLYVHYVSPKGTSVDTVLLGLAGGECGFLPSRTRELFPFNPSAGKWTLQFDTRRQYSAHPNGHVARVTETVG